MSTFRTSGNVIFDAGRDPRAKIGRRIEAGLAKSLGFDVAIFLRTASEIRAIAAYKPFRPKLVTASEGKLQVALLSKKPTDGLRRTVLAAKYFAG